VTPRVSDPKILPPGARSTNALGTASGLSVKPPGLPSAKPTNMFGWTEPSDKVLKGLGLLSVFLITGLAKEWRR